MELKHKLEQIFNNDYPGTDRFIADVIEPIFGNEIEYINDDLAEREVYAEKAKKAGIKHIKYIGDLTEKNYNADNIALLDVTLDDSKNIERSRVNIQQLIRSIMDYRQHLMIVFHYEDVKDKQWRFSYAYKGDSLKDSTSAKRYTYVFGKGYRGRTAAERFQTLADSTRNNEDFEKAFSVAALSDEFFDKYRDIYADFVQYITGKRYEKIKNKWEEVKKEDPNTEIFSQFNNDDKRVRDYIKKMLGRLTFLCFLQRKGWMNRDRNFIQNLYQTSPQQDDFLDAVMEPLFFGVLNTPPEKRKEVFIKNGWNTDLADEWGNIPYLNGGLFEQTRDDKLTVKFPKKLFQELFKFLGEYNFTIDENDPDDAEVGIDPEMLGRVFESLLEDNKDKGAFYTPKEIVQYMCRQSIIEYLNTHTDQSLHADVEDLINKGLVNHALQNKDNARNLYKFLKEVTVCDPAIGSGAFPMGILNILFTARQHLYGFLKESEPFNPLEVKKSIIRDNIYGVDIEQGAVDIARLRFWLAILVEEQVATPLPNLDYRIVRGNSLITTFNDEYIKLPENPDGRTKLAKLKKELHQLQNELFDLNGDEKLQREIEIKCKILEIIKVQLGIDKANAQEESKIESDIFENKKLSVKALKKAQQAHAIEEVKSKSLFALNNLITSLTTPATSLADRAQIDIKFFDWKIVFSNIFSDVANVSGFDIVIGNPPYIQLQANKGKLYKLYSHACFETCFATGDIYCLFYELGHTLLKDGGILSLINSNSWLQSLTFSPFRKYVTTKFLWDKILITEKMFNAVVDTHCVQFIKKDGYKDCDILLYDSQNITFSHRVSKDRVHHTEDCINIVSNNEQIAVIDKLFKTSYLLKDLFTVYNGVKPFEKGKGIPPQTSDIVKSKPYVHIGEKLDNSWTPLLRGSLINKYCLLWKNNYWIQYGPWLAAPRNKDIFDAPKKIVIRQTGDSIIATLIDNRFICRNNLHICISNKDNIYEYVLGILNSKLMNYAYSYINPEKGEALAEIKKAHVERLPIRFNERYFSPITAIVNTMLSGTQLNLDFESLSPQIDHIVYHLYELTYDEVLIVDPQTPISREEYESFNIDTYGQS